MITSFRPSNVIELLNLINENDMHILAGGTDLMIRKRNFSGAKRKFEKDVVCISHLDELKGITDHSDFYEIKTCTTQADMASSSILPEYIKHIYYLMGNPAIRNVATVGGNLVNAASVGDTLPLLFALDAIIVLKSVNGIRELKCSEFIIDKYKTDIKKNEILYSIKIPKDKYSNYFYTKLGTRKASILSKVSIIILYNIEDCKLTRLKVSIGALNSKPIISKEFEDKFIQNLNTEEFLTNIKTLFNATEDKRSNKDYKEEVIQNLLINELENIKELLCTI